MNERERDYSPESTAIEGTDGVAILAGDGRHWRFAGPGVRYRPKRVKVEAPPLTHWRTDVEVVWDLPIEVKRPLARALYCAGQGDDSGTIAAIYQMAVPMLTACHQLTDDQVGEILEFGPDVDRFAARLLNVAMGHPPDRMMGPGPDETESDPLAPIPLAGDDPQAEPPATNSRREDADV